MQKQSKNWPGVQYPLNIVLRSLCDGYDFQSDCITIINDKVEVIHKMAWQSGIFVILLQFQWKNNNFEELGLIDGRKMPKS